MSRDEQRAFFLELLKTVPAAEIARQTGYSPGAISAVKNGNYGGGDSLVLEAIFIRFGRWECPANDNTEIDHDQCQINQNLPPAASRIRQWAICQKCTRRA